MFPPGRARRETRIPECEPTLIPRRSAVIQLPPGLPRSEQTSEQLPNLVLFSPHFACSPLASRKIEEMGDAGSRHLCSRRGEPDGKPDFLIGHRHLLQESLRFRPGWADISSAGGASHRLTNSTLNEARRVGTTIKTPRDVVMSAFQAWFYSVSLSGASRPRQRICQPSGPEECCVVII
jgi:hypothetical protein